MGSAPSAFPKVITHFPEVSKWRDKHWRKAALSLFEHYEDDSGRMDYDDIFRAFDEALRGIGAQKRDRAEVEKIFPFTSGNSISFETFLPFFREAVLQLRFDSSSTDGKTTCFFIGLNYRGSKHGWTGAETVRELGKLYNAEVILTDDGEGTDFACLDNVLGHFRMLAQREWSRGDSLFFFFSGHACNVPDGAHSVGSAGKDEGLCLVDKAGDITLSSCFLDDMLASCVQRLTAGVRVVILLDLCYNATLVFNQDDFVFDHQICSLTTAVPSGCSAGPQIIEAIKHLKENSNNTRRKSVDEVVASLRTFGRRWHLQGDGSVLWPT